jgi:hypothetical protein
MSPRSRRIAALCCAAGLVLLACGDDTASEAAPVSTSVDPTESTPAPQSPSTAAPGTTTIDTAVATTDGVGEPAAVVPASLQFTAPLVGGGTFDGASVAGAPVVFWFWAPG